jgi:putative NADPH-quinone reductase
MTRTILGFCGIKTRRLSQFAPIRPSTEEQRQRWLRQAEALGESA